MIIIDSISNNNKWKNEFFNKIECLIRAIDSLLKFFINLFSIIPNYNNKSVNMNDLIGKFSRGEITNETILNKLDFKKFKEKKNEIINGLKGIQSKIDAISPNLEDLIVGEFSDKIYKKLLHKLIDILISATKSSEFLQFLQIGLNEYKQALNEVNYEM